MLSNSKNSFSQRVVFGTVALVSCGALVAVARSNGAQNAPTSTRLSVTSVPRSPGRSVQVAQAPVAAQAAPVSDDGRRPVEFYTGSVRGGLFSAPEPPAPKQPKVVETPKALKEPKVDVQPEEVNPFDNWTYSGIITSGTEKIAVIENRTTKEGVFLKVGDSTQGARLTEIENNMLTFKAGKKPYYLAQSQNMNVTPLDRSAIPTSTQQGGQQPGQQQPGQQPAQVQQMQIAPTVPGGQNDSDRFNRFRAMMGGGAGGMVTLPNGMQLDPSQFQRRSQRMNRNFNQ